MEKIQSFQVDHTILNPGIYVSRVDGDVTTYDLRTRKPNAGDYMDHATMHSLEHMFATYVRNSNIASKVLYFGPMGCQTGFYLLVRNTDNERVLEVIKEVLHQIASHTGEMFGKSEVECGNYRNLEVELAKKEASSYVAVLESNNHTFQYM
ncbi:MAG: S-ribosylhomocysteine lyase [Eubacteriales bacterium]